MSSTVSCQPLPKERFCLVVLDPIWRNLTVLVEIWVLPGTRLSHKRSWRRKMNWFGSSRRRKLLNIQWSVRSNSIALSYFTFLPSENIVIPQLLCPSVERLRSRTALLSSFVSHHRSTPFGLSFSWICCQHHHSTSKSFQVLFYKPLAFTRLKSHDSIETESNFKVTRVVKQLPGTSESLLLFNLCSGRRIRTWIHAFRERWPTS